MAFPGNREHGEGEGVPRLQVEWASTRSTMLDNLRAVLQSVEPAHGTLPVPYFRTWIQTFHFPRKAVLASALWHIALVWFPFPGVPGARPQPVEPITTRYHLTWYGPARDLKPFRAPAVRPRPKPAERKPRRGADAFHPRQTIISAPRLPTHPRQTLIQPAAPQLAPKMLPPLPNIVQWNEPARPKRPRLQFRAPAAPRVRQRAVQVEAAVPAIPNQEKNLGALNLAASNVKVPRPRLALRPMAVPKVTQRQINGDAAAPDIGLGTGATANEAPIQQLIALSANPAPPAPVVEVPSGNLQANITISPEGTQSGVPSGLPTGVTNGGAAGSPGGAGGSGSSAGVGGGGAGTMGPSGISITGGEPRNAVSVVGPGGTPGIRAMPGTPLPAKPEPRPVPVLPGRTRPVPTIDAIKPGAPLEEILGPKRVYTLHVNMPNLTSATGSWILRFAELEQEEGNSASPGSPGGEADLAGPVPLRKVDPKYPPALASAKIEGTVILYAIIRRDGSVDSIQLMKGVEPQLDRNAMDALARWKFRPAERHGQPIELEAVVQIPFRAISIPF